MTPVLYVASVAPLCDADLYRLAYGTVSEERRKKTDTYRFEKDRRLSLGVETLLNGALAERGIRGLPSRIVRDENGKPYFEGGEVRFSLSHAGEYVACALSDAPVGCDIEQICDADLRIAERFFSKEEYENILSEKTAEGRSERFFRYWTLKESFAKVTGKGLAQPFASFTVRWDKEGKPLSPSIDGKGYAFTEYDGLKGYRAALCAARAEGTAQTVVLDLAEILRGRGKI